MFKLLARVMSYNKIKKQIWIVFKNVVEMLEIEVSDWPVVLFERNEFDNSVTLYNRLIHFATGIYILL